MKYQLPPSIFLKDNFYPLNYSNHKNAYIFQSFFLKSKTKTFLSKYEPLLTLFIIFSVSQSV